MWERIIGLVRKSCGTLTFPLKPGADQSALDDKELFAASGCNLFTQTPEIRNWLLGVHADKPLCVGGYAYIPGDLFPRVALAMDVIIKALTEERGASVAHRASGSRSRSGLATIVSPRLCLPGPVSVSVCPVSEIMSLSRMLNIIYLRSRHSAASVLARGRA